ncbi:unnamed protein product [Acanthosepion pharaonis]|uniref:Uncharacterized protein n=1 Tax=Acanthosepion pharaonis TaxID=158019 RepID=A0A812D465_ACAPH|nr:unnamed protein product [Sepia pharaonis]
MYSFFHCFSLPYKLFPLSNSYFLLSSSLYSFIQNQIHLSYLVFNVSFLVFSFFHCFFPYNLFHSQITFYLSSLYSFIQNQIHLSYFQMFNVFFLPLFSTVFHVFFLPLSFHFLINFSTVKFLTFYLALLCILSSKIKAIFLIEVFHVFFLPLSFHFLINFSTVKFPTFYLALLCILSSKKIHLSYFFSVFNVFFLPLSSLYSFIQSQIHLFYLGVLMYSFFHCIFTSLKLFPLSNPCLLLSSFLYSFIQNQSHLSYLGVPCILSSTVFHVFFLPLSFHFLIIFPHSLIPTFYLSIIVFFHPKSKPSFLFRCSMYSFFHCVPCILSSTVFSLPYKLFPVKFLLSTYLFFVFFHPKQKSIFPIYILPLYFLPYKLFPLSNSNFWLALLLFFHPKSNFFPFRSNVFFSSTLFFVFFHPKSNPSFLFNVFCILSSTVFSLPYKLFPLSNSYFLLSSSLYSFIQNQIHLSIFWCLMYSFFHSLLCILSSKIKSIFPIWCFNVFFLPLYFHFLINFFHCQIPTFYLALLCILSSKVKNHLFFFHLFSLPYKLFQVFSRIFLLSSTHPNIFTSLINSFSTVKFLFPLQIHKALLCFNVFFLPLYFHFLINFFTVKFPFFFVFFHPNLHLSYFLLSPTFFILFPSNSKFFQNPSFLFSSSLYSFSSKFKSIFLLCLFFLPLSFLIKFFKIPSFFVGLVFFHPNVKYFPGLFNVFFLPLYFHFLINFFHCQIPYFLWLFF